MTVDIENIPAQLISHVRKISLKREMWDASGAWREGSVRGSVLRPDYSFKLEVELEDARGFTDCSSADWFQDFGDSRHLRTLPEKSHQ